MPGTIVFKPIEANIISKDKDVLGKMDPYLSFHLGGLKRVKGEVAKSGGQHPIWNDAITVEVSDQSSLTVDLKDKDMLIDDKIASFEVDLREVQSQGRVRKWYPIFRKSEPAGELLMEATFSGMGGQFGTGLNQGQYAGVGGYGTGLSQGQGQYGTGLNQGQGYSGTGLSQGQGYSATGMSQGPIGTTTGLNQGQYGTTTGLSQGQGQYGTGLTQGQGYSGSNIYGQSGNVITTPGTVISHTSTSYPVQQGTQFTSGGLQQGTQFTSGGLQQGTQYKSGGLQQGTQYPSGGLQQGGTQYSAVPLGSNLQQGQYGTSNLQQGQYGNLPQSQYGNLPQGQLGGLQSGFPQGQGQGYGSQGSQISSEQFAKEALLRGSDPLNTRQNEVYNLGQAGYGGYGVPHQNLTQTPSFSGTDPLLYEGDKNRFSNPPQQVPYKGKTIEEYGHRHGKHGTTPTTDPYSGYSSTLAKEGQY